MDGGHVLVVDDDRRLRELLGKYLTENGYLVVTAADAAEARARMAGLAFDLIVLDVMMPGEDGMSLTRSLRAVGDRVPILLLTARGEVDDRIRGLEAGADDYLSKPFEPRELLLRVGSILRRAPRDEAEPVVTTLRLGPFTWDIERAELRRGDQPVHLTQAERDLLAVLAETAGQGVSRDELAARTGSAATPRAVDVQVTRLRKKIEDDPRLPRYLQTVRGTGYMLRPD
ncbi:response regulator [Magnetospirillum molischianum]|uniref:Putative two-component response transcriptional regulator (OmpR family) n=1 Tax=Magnetospirillum molischianum DSM 120 TaxID=1150626 RepID=H8FSY2_MAGML|nr:response regulator [Magnetospirillum molischianum]CCG41470.1 Putative two-component response transcriptional regulator (OmpR family) [Magnetospirillum molischianum DSM 120]